MSLSWRIRRRVAIAPLGHTLLSNPTIIAKPLRPPVSEPLSQRCRNRLANTGGNGEMENKAMSDANHEFDSPDYVRKWADSADQRRPQRRAMFEHIVALVEQLCKPAVHIVELGCGPGALAAK